MVWVLVAMGGMLMSPTQLEPSALAAPLDRVVVRRGAFVEKRSGKAFRPIGMNYIKTRAEKGGYLWHDTLNPASFSLSDARAAFADMQAHGYNVIRVFLDHMHGAGIAGDPDGPPLAKAYVDNLIALLRAASAHGIRAILTPCYTADHPAYRSKGETRGHRVDGANSPWFNDDFIAARARYIADIVAAIARTDRGLLGALFSIETENEVHMIAAAPPFEAKEGSFEFAGKTYDLGSESDLQRLADDASIVATNAVVRAVRKVDRDVMVSANVFTFRAVGRSGPGKLRTDKTPDTRFPVRPLALARSEVAYLDVHIYPFGSGTIDQDYRSIEFNALREACRNAGKPMIVGEIGAFRNPYPDLAAAARAMRESVDRLMRDGFVGFLYWTYDNREQSDQIWNARAGDGAILRALAPKAGR